MDAGSLSIGGTGELSARDREDPTRDRTDIELIRAARKGDSEAFELLVHRHLGQVLKLALGMLGSREDAEDVVQEVFARAHRSLPRFRSEARFSTWIHRIAINRCRDVLRRRKPAPPLATSEEDENAGTLPAQTRARNPLRAVQEQEQLLQLRAGLEELPPRQRAALLLRLNQGLSHQEIARILGTTEASSRVYVAEAKKQLVRRWSSP